MLVLPEDMLHPKDQIHIETGMIATIVVCLIMVAALVALTVLLSRPSRKNGKKSSPGRHNPASGKSEWLQRIDAIVSNHENGRITREEAFAQLAALARDYASQATGTDMRNHTLSDIEATPRTTGNQQRLTLLRQTIESLYPPEFADAEHNHTAREATVEQAGQWVANLVERWR